VVVADNSVLVGMVSIELKLMYPPVLFDSSAKPIRPEVRLSNKSVTVIPNNRFCVVPVTIRNFQSVDLENVAHRSISETQGVPEPWREPLWHGHEGKRTCIPPHVCLTIPTVAVGRRSLTMRVSVPQTTPLHGAFELPTKGLRRSQLLFA
jgi:hypothetical protein